MQRALIALSCLLALTLSPAAAFAQARGGAASDPSMQDRIAEVDTRPDYGRPISLDEAIALGLQNNLDLEVNRYAPYTAQLDSESAWGAYDLNFAGDATYTGSVPDKIEELSPGRFTQSGVDGSLGLQQMIPYVGATLGIRFDANNLTQDRCIPNTFPPVGPNDPRCGTDFVNNLFVPTYNPKGSGLTFTGNIPLMKGLLWNEPWTQVKISRLSYGSALDEFTTSVMDTVASIVADYWILVAAKEQQRVAEKSLESTAALLDQVRTQYQVGVVSRVEVVEAEAGVANAEFNLIVAQNNYRNAQDLLIASVLGDRIRADTRMLFNPTDNPSFTSVQPVDLNRAVATAFAKRPELAAAEKRLLQGEVQVKFAKNQRLPQFDIRGSYRAGGTVAEGDLNGDGLLDSEPEFKESFDQWFDGNRDWTVGGVVTFPIQNTTARNNATKAKIELRRANSQVNRLRQSIIVAVRKAARGLLASSRGVEAAERRRLAAAEQLRAEKIRLEHGESTPFDVLLRETELVDAESQKIAALKAFRDSQVILERAQGTILEDRNVAIEQVRRLY